ncbi:MAG: hypothetical protein NC388_00005, partial [Clostridium sp.]|nr:hypothetical protein [Clostridium sp.]
YMKDKRFSFSFIYPSQTVLFFGKAADAIRNITLHETETLKHANAHLPVFESNPILQYSPAGG